MKHTKTTFVWTTARLRRRMSAGAAILALSACSSLLEVDNPNNVSADALDVPAAASAIVAGAENLTGNALSSMLNFYVPATDEAFWVGSRDDYRLLDSGEFGINTNEYTQSGYLIVASSRWMADQAVKKLSKFNADGALLDKQLLVKAYLIAATNYINIADKFDDIAFSDRTQAGANYGEANMVALYDSATKWLDSALPLASGTNRAYVLGLRARAKQSKAIWQKLNPAGTTPANGLVGDASGSVADAQAALAAEGGDWFYDITTNDLNQGDGSGGGFGFEMNSRVEYTPSLDLVTLKPNNTPLAVIAKDPVTGQTDAAAQKMITRVTTPSNLNSPPLAQASTREMFLIIAEAALAAGNNAGFDTAINQLRALDGKAAYTGAGPTRLQLLQWERRINLIFEGRRLNDMYRFGIKDPKWVAASLAVNKPGCLFPIPLIELEANKKITGTPLCK